MSGRPRYPVNDLAEQARYYHHLEWGTANGYEYTTTRVRKPITRTDGRLSRRRAGS